MKTSIEIERIGKRYAAAGFVLAQRRISVLCLAWTCRVLGKPRSDDVATAVCRDGVIWR
jgi:hypothetical protein